jgi:hypothetical protein
MDVNRLVFHEERHLHAGAKKAQVMAHGQKPGESPHAGKLGGPRGGEEASSRGETVGADYSHHIL